MLKINLYDIIFTVLLASMVLWNTRANRSNDVNNERLLRAIDSLRQECTVPIEPDSIFVNSYRDIDTTDYGEVSDD